MKKLGLDRWKDFAVELHSYMVAESSTGLWFSIFPRAPLSLPGCLLKLLRMPSEDERNDTIAVVQSWMFETWEQLLDSLGWKGPWGTTWLIPPSPIACLRVGSPCSHVSEELLWIPFLKICKGRFCVFCLVENAGTPPFITGWSGRSSEQSTLFLPSVTQEWATHGSLSVCSPFPPTPCVPTGGSPELWLARTLQSTVLLHHGLAAAGNHWPS